MRHPFFFKDSGELYVEKLLAFKETMQARFAREGIIKFATTSLFTFERQRNFFSRGNHSFYSCHSVISHHFFFKGPIIIDVPSRFL